MGLIQICSGIENLKKSHWVHMLRFSNCLHAFMNNENKSECKCSRKSKKNLELEQLFKGVSILGNSLQVRIQDPGRL